MLASLTERAANIQLSDGRSAEGGVGWSRSGAFL